MSLIRQSYLLAKSFHPRIAANERELRVRQIPAESHRAEIHHAFELRHGLFFVSKPGKYQRILESSEMVGTKRWRIGYQFAGFHGFGGPDLLDRPVGGSVTQGSRALSRLSKCRIAAP